MTEQCVSLTRAIHLPNPAPLGQPSCPAQSSKATCTGRSRSNTKASTQSTRHTPAVCVPSGCMCTGSSFRTRGFKYRPLLPQQS